MGLQTGQDSIAQCIWGECGADCPAGTTPAQRSDGHDRGNVGLWNGCALRGLSSKQRNYCWYVFHLSSKTMKLMKIDRSPTNSNDKDYSHFARSRKLTEDQTFPLVSGEVLRHFVMASVRMGRYRLQQTHLGQVYFSLTISSQENCSDSKSIDRGKLRDWAQSAMVRCRRAIEWEALTTWPSCTSTASDTAIAQCSMFKITRISRKR